MANNITPVSQQDIDAVDDLLKELKGRAAASHKDGKMLIHGVYTQLINLVSPEVVKLHARIEREDRAGNNKLFKESKKAARNGQASA
jgi:hypothetical protein